ncbi:MAG TPA: hypothetical protein PK264_24080, partial [Hyphomicrobiaceae bacterium]|nr:hypothetical protein [Hyphomicrobiaceae bacterium]
HADGATAAEEALRLLLPYAERLPAAHGPLAGTIAKDIIVYSEKAGREPDVTLLTRLAIILGSKGS